MGQRSILITGCSAGGIGHAFVKEFHSRGLKVFATARRLDSMSDLEGLQGVKLLKLDVTDIESIRSARNEVASLTGGKLDILVNNAIMAVSDMDIDIARRTFEINVHGAISMVQEFIQLLVASGDGCVVNSGSIAGILPLPFSAAYNGSKAAVHALSNTLRVELAPFNVKVVNLVAGEVSSSTSRALLLPDDSLYKPIESTLLRKCGRISQATVLPTAHYAKRVVNELSKSKPKPWYWYGDRSLLCWIFDTFLWKTSLDGMLIKMFGISELAGLIQSEKAKND
ncbi:NAD-P-binding protein [Lentinula raphanica]|nr:NAD-P-binding protein [Lentinula raphanica]